MMTKKERRTLIVVAAVLILVAAVILVVGCAVTKTHFEISRQGDEIVIARVPNGSAVAGAGAAGIEAASETGPAAVRGPARWMELPAGGNDGLTHYATMDGKRQRNYTMLYDPTVYASYWVAYPLCASHLGTGRTETWAYDPSVEVTQQTKVSSGSYGVSFTGEVYQSNYYARGHQIPNADRNGNDEMMAQTYYSTNMTPQIQNGFNGGIWAKLEAGVRSMVPAGDTLYIVTGAAFRKAGGSEKVATIVSTRDGKTLPVPNYYWKAILKVKRAPDGSVTDAQTLGFWLPHKEIKGATYPDFTVSVDQIEAWTGFDMFPSLPDAIENARESNSSLDVFLAF